MAFPAQSLPTLSLRDPATWSYLEKSPSRRLSIFWWPGAESNHRHADFQSAALPTELPGLFLKFANADFQSLPTLSLRDPVTWPRLRYAASEEGGY